MSPVAGTKHRWGVGAAITTSPTTLPTLHKHTTHTRMSSIIQDINNYIGNLHGSISNIAKFTDEDQMRSNKKFKRTIGYQMPEFTESKNSVITTFRSGKHSVSCEISKPDGTTWEDLVGPVDVSHIQLIFTLAIGNPARGEFGDIHTLVALSTPEFGQQVCVAMNESPYTNRYRTLVTRLWRTIGFSVCMYRLRACYMMDEMEREGASEGEVLLASYQAKAAHENSTSNERILAMAFPTAAMKVAVV